MTAQLNLREQEVVSELESLASFKKFVLGNLTGEYAAEARKILAALATALDFRRGHPNPKHPPFAGKKPRMELSVFFIGHGFIGVDYVCVGVHQEGWVVLFTTSVTTQVQQFEAERYISMVADWEASDLLWLAEASDPDRRGPAKIPGAGSATNIDLYPFFRDHAYRP